jgi:hypothetical protein
MGIVPGANRNAVISMDDMDFGEKEPVLREQVHKNHHLIEKFQYLKQQSLPNGTPSFLLPTQNKDLRTNYRYHRKIYESRWFV